MQFKSFFISTLALASYASAAAIAIRNDPQSQCNTGPVQCCNSINKPNDPGASLLGGLLGIDLSGILGDVGLQCNPLSILGMGESGCSTQPVCCNGNNFSGLIVLGCSPINL